MPSFANHVYEQLGGTASFSQEIGSETEMESAVRGGLPTSVLKQIEIDWKLTIIELSRTLAIPRTNLMQMMRCSRRMTSADSDRVYRLVEVLSLAEESVGDRWRTLAWLRTPNSALGLATPMRAIETEAGRLRVIQSLGAIAYGSVS